MESSSFIPSATVPHPTLTKNSSPVWTADEMVLPAPIPGVPLMLRLHGVVIYKHGEGRAFISVNGGYQQTYLKGDVLAEGVYVMDILRNKVTINQYGVVKTLYLEYQSERQQSQDATPSSEISQQLALMQQEKRRNPIRLFLLRRPYPVFEAGEFIGYRLMPGSNQDQFIKLGIEAGDIVTNVNGVEFSSPGNGRALIDTLTYSESIELTVLRDKQLVNISYGF